ncbi:hypothetical protein [Streptomyces indicus]|uniref:MYXO-CTERM domain-containing protein n=1 Tax=Streptomyces indicus TaxID=417292 RepID=A0A1G9D7Z0_9ACTN|nr:hypothetical protein [Streptomyces indicus]SDK59983.1 hypothetical protein SAMN05421806_10970 [Streptomyces indicus]
MRIAATRLLAASALALSATVAAGPAVADSTGTGSLELYPTSVTPGTTVTANTPACGTSGTAAGDASAVGAGSFKLEPTTHAQDAVGTFTVPNSASPGTYAIRAKCAGGAEISGDLIVTLTAAKQQVAPKGHVKTGVGGALGPGPVQTAAGVAALAVAAAGGTWLLHRRARGDGI